MSPKSPAESAADAPVPAGRLVALKPYAIGTAARLAGIPPETLRIWERRYELLAPARTDGGHRLYSEDDVALLRAVKRLVDAGMRIGTIARLGVDGIRDEVAKLGPPTTAASTIGQGATPLIDEIVLAASSLDERRVAQLLDRPLLLAGGPEVVTTVYLPLLQRIGDLWHAGIVSVAVEHFVEKLVTTRVHAVLQSTPQPVGGRLALCVCPPDERHEVGLFAAALLLKSNGFMVTILGADLPAADLESAIDATMPSVLVMAVTNLLTPAAAASLIPVLEQGNARRLPLIVGGPAQHSLTSRLTRDDVHIVDRLGDVVAVADRVCG
ncbi:MAG TPA: MerR family transcriptional regulator [Myxococcota bacterium]